MGGVGLRLSLSVRLSLCLRLRLRLSLRMSLSLLLVLLLSGGDRCGVGRTLTLLRLTWTTGGDAGSVEHTVRWLGSVLRVDGSTSSSRRRRRRDGVRVNRRLRSERLRWLLVRARSLILCATTTGRHGRVCEAGRRALEAAVRGSGRLSGRTGHDRDGRLVRERDGAERAMLVRPSCHQLRKVTLVEITRYLLASVGGGRARKRGRPNRRERARRPRPKQRGAGRNSIGPQPTKVLART
jgi:hypothetical protein